MGSPTGTPFIRLEHTSNGHFKFWEVEFLGLSATDPSGVIRIRWGKIGTTGQSQTKVFYDMAQSDMFVGKLLAEKIGKGYHVAEVGGAIPYFGVLGVSAKTAAKPAPKAPANPPAKGPKDDPIDPDDDLAMFDFLG